jgi:hypothetical protein
MYLATKVNEGVHDAELALSRIQPLEGEWCEIRDDPLICQLAGNDVGVMLSAAQRIERSIHHH